MEKRKTYEISIIDKTYSKIISDETKFYTSDTALELGFELKETEYDFESAEIVLLNVEDRSLVTRPVAKNLDSFAYELEDDIIAHYGEWRGQLRFEQAGEIYISSPVKFRIENDLSNERPPQLSDVQSWVSLKRYADSLTEELKQAVLSVEGIEDTFNENETIRQNKFETAEQSRQDTFEMNESERNKTFNTNESTRQEVTTQLAQTDFVSQVSRLIGGYEKMYYKRENSLGWMTVMLRNGLEHVSWTFRNNTADDFIILGDCFYGHVTESFARYGEENYDSVTGTWNTSSSNNYTTQVGATFTKTMMGEKFEFNHYANNQGGLFEFIVDGDVENPVIVSTYSETPVPVKTSLIVEGLPFGEHTIVATFKGDDPNNPPYGGASSSRGWVAKRETSPKTFYSYKTQLTNSRIQDLLVGFSNKEFAFRIRKAETSHSTQFIPMHSGIGTAFKKVEPRFIADGKVIDYVNLPFAEFFECNTFRLVQSVYGRNPESADENLMEINTNVTINKSGNVEIAGKMEPLSDIEIENGYGIMFPVKKDITTKAISSKGNEYPTIKTDYSSTFMSSESDTTTSFAFVSEENPDFIASVRFNDIMNTLKANEEKDATSFWIEHRDVTMQKLYFRVFRNRTLTPEDTFKFSGTFNCGKVPSVHNVM